MLAGAGSGFVSANLKKTPKKIEFFKSPPPEMERENTPEFRSVKTHISDQFLCLPAEIIEEILSRLPVKSLSKFRCVSKPWRSLIASQRFIDKHLANSTRNAIFSHHKIILNSLKPQGGRELKQCSLPSMLNDPSTNQFRFCDSLNIGKELIRIVGCCNGLVCILYERKFFMLWNPSTRMVKKFPLIDPEIEFELVTSYGFGFDCLSGDYKVFGVLSPFVPAGNEAIVKVYSLETNSWKLIKDRNVNVSLFQKKGKFASGKLHWLRFVGSDCSEIASFDLGSEACGVVELPCYGPCGGGFEQSMEAIEGRLAILCDYLTRLDVWVMREYGVRESWEKVVTVPALTLPVGCPYTFPGLLALGPNGEVLLTHKFTIVIYYPQGDGYRQFRVENLAPFGAAQICVESLVSVDPCGEQEACSAE